MTAPCLGAAGTTGWERSWLGEGTAMGARKPQKERREDAEGVPGKSPARALPTALPGTSECPRGTELPSPSPGALTALLWHE